MKFTPHPILKGPSPEQIRSMCFNADGTSNLKGLADLIQLHKMHEEAIINAENDPLGCGIALPQQDEVKRLLGEKTEVWVFGGNRCLAGEQEIYDPVQQKSLRVDEIEGDFHVNAWDESTSQVVQAVALAPFRKQPLDLFQVHLGTGEALHCSMSHKVLSFGSYYPIATVAFLDVPASEDVSLADLPVSDGYHLLSTLDIDPSTSLGDVRRYLQTAQDSQWNYSVYCCLDGGQPRHLLDSVLYDSPPLDDALEYISYAFSAEDGSEYKSQCIRLYLLLDLPSTQDVLPQTEGQFSGIQSRASCKPCKSVSRSREDREFFEAHQQSIVEFSHRLQSSFLSGTQGIRYFCLSSLGGIRNYHTPVVKSDYLRTDTVWDFTVPVYHNYFIGETVHHNSGKSHDAAKHVVMALVNNPGTLIICWAQDKDASIEMQQPYIYSMLPEEYKGAKIKEKVANVSYNEKTGFTGFKIVLRNGSKCIFKFYTQFANNEKMIEGYKLGCKPELCKYPNIGTWADEYYGDDKLIKRLYRRCADNDASILVTFTPLDGHTPTVGLVLNGAQTLKTLPTDPSILPNHPTMPYVMQPKKATAGVVFFHTLRNPFTNKKRFKDDLFGETEDNIMTLAYGWPTKSMTTIFPLFSEATHVIDELPAITKATHTVYQVIDPADARNFSCIWAAVDKDRNITVLAEWPDRDTYGEWAVFGDPKWKHGPSAKKLGYAIKTDVEEYSYPELFKEIEKNLGIEVFERIGDCRFMATERDNQDLFTDFESKGMDVVPSDGRGEAEGIQMIDEWFIYNPNIEMDSINKPKIKIYKQCGNLIYSIINYHTDGKKAEALKDWIDCLRYLRTANCGEGPEHYAPEAFIQTPQIGGY